MIQLIIEGQRVVVPESFTATLLEENPIYTKNSTYTWDLDLSLENPTNAEVYRHINRINVVNGVQENRRAILIVDEKVVLDGTEIILKISDTSVKIQLASGNSQLNFLVGGKGSIRDLNLGSAVINKAETVEQTAANIFLDLQFTYPDRDFQLLPYATNEFLWGTYSSYVGNAYKIVLRNYGGLEYRAFEAYYLGSFSGYVPQPFFCFIIKQIIESLGYVLSYNCLAEHPIWRRAYLVHGIQTYEYAKMLPDWTVEEFLAKIELQYDCAFLINSDKTVELRFKYESDNGNKQTLVAQEVYSCQIDRENISGLSGANIAYDLDDDEYYRYMDIDPRYRQRAGTDTSIVDLEAAWNALNNDSSLGDKSQILSWQEFGEYQPEQFVVVDLNNTTDSTGVPNNNRTLKKVEGFKPLINNPNKTDFDHKFDIIPAPMRYYVQKGTTVEGGFAYDNFWVQIPIAEAADPLDTSRPLENEFPDIPIDLQELIEGDTSLKDPTVPSKMRLAIYRGLDVLKIQFAPNPEWAPAKAFYPLSYVEHADEMFPDTGDLAYTTGEIGKDPFRLENMYKDIYSKSKAVNTTRTYKFTFKIALDFDIRSVFVINNKEFVCFKVERQITSNGFSEFAVGYFYPKESN